MYRRTGGYVESYDGYLWYPNENIGTTNGWYTSITRTEIGKINLGYTKVNSDPNKEFDADIYKSNERYSEITNKKDERREFNYEGKSWFSKIGVQTSFNGSR